ncbi:hypothetical protein EV06_0353 [Prochlorococcus sp. MIT 0602]|nr:hypothetical protein EV06_0353 [Prochlorococcus sp. MIT 0602]KGG17012.1 hypothetical protein EV07_0440 [Prochlorococcus sp. MIT 0603]
MNLEELQETTFGEPVQIHTTSLDPEVQPRTLKKGPVKST